MSKTGSSTKDQGRATSLSEKALLRRSLEEHAAVVERTQKSLQEGYLASIQALLRTLEARDPYTRGHSERVRAWTIRIGRQIGRSELEIEDLGLAARLHDLGKVGIRDAVLEKPGPLSAEEWKVMRSHPAVAVEILSPIRMLQSILPLIRGHHERWDGKGYPDGIQGEAIPLGARVIAVADAYDAMVTDRPYRTGFPREKAREVLQMGAGTQWDTTAVDALLFVQTHANKNNTQPSNPSHHLVRDPVCSMVVVLEVAQAQVIFDDQVVYFCSTACRELFDRNPLIYMRGLSP